MKQPLVLPPHDTAISLDEKAEFWHADLLREFEERVYPIYRRRGIKFGEALMLFMLNSIDDRLYNIDKKLAEGQSL